MHHRSDYITQQHLITGEDRRSRRGRLDSYEVRGENTPIHTAT